MENRKDQMEQIITEDLMMEAASIEKEIAGMEVEVPDEFKEKMKKRLHAQIDEYEKENLYAQLSEEDRKALEVGKEMLQDKTVYRRKSKKMYVALIAVAVLVLAMGVTSIGGAERIAKMFWVNVGEREITRVNTDDDNYLVKKENEEEVYQALKDTFGVDVVRPVHWPGKVLFLSAEIDKELQTALLNYEFEGEIISYYINAFYVKSSWGADVEDIITDQYSIEHEKCMIKIKEHETSETKTKYYSAEYTDKNIEYRLVGIIEESDFNYLIKNLIFF